MEHMMTDPQSDQEPQPFADVVVGYEWQGSTWCPLDLIMHMCATGAIRVDIHEGMTVEDTLRAQARALGDAYDARTFPVAVDRGDAEAEDFCDRCDRLLSDEAQGFADNM